MKIKMFAEKYAIKFMSQLMFFFQQVLNYIDCCMINGIYAVVIFALNVVIFFVVTMTASAVKRE